MSRDFILGPQAALGNTWFDQTQIAGAKIHGEACPATAPADTEAPVIRVGGSVTSFNLHQYYDLPLTLYIAHQRSGDPALLSLAQKCADAWWQHPQWIGSGSIRQWPDSVSPPPRHAGIGGLILRALDGRPEMWSWIVGCTQFNLDLWVKRRINNSQLYYGTREGAFSLHFAAWLAKTLPDSYPDAATVRAQLLADIENVCVNYFGRLQHADGSWRWNTSADEGLADDGGTLQQIMQPFMVGLLLCALVDAHQVVTSESVKENIKNQILKGCRHLYEGGPYAKDHVATNFNVKVRGFHYFYHGGTTVSPTRYVQGDIPLNWDTTERWHVESARQAISTIIPAYGYAYKISGDSFFKTAGDELFDSAYNGSDGFRAMAADTAHGAKNYNQHYRRAGSYLVWAGQPAIPVPAPSPTPSPAPAPTPTLPVVAVTSPINGATVSGMVVVAATISDNISVNTAYLIVDDVVYGSDSTSPYSYNLDTTKLADGSHSLYIRVWDTSGNAKDSAKVTFIVANAVPLPQPVPVPTPVPIPTPVPTKPEYVVKTFSKTIASRNALYKQMYSEGYAAWEDLDARTIRFRLFPKT